MGFFSKTLSRDAVTFLPTLENESLVNLEALMQSLSALTKLGKLSKPEDKNKVIQTILDTIKEAFGWAYGSYWELTSDKTVLKFAVQSGHVNEAFEQVTQNASFAKGVGLSGKTWQQGRLMFVEDLGEMTDCCRRPVAQKAGVKSGVCFPIMMNGTFVGTMDFFTTKTIALSTERTETLEALAKLVSIVFQQVESSLKELEGSQCATAASAVVNKLEHAKNQQEIIQRALDEIKSTFGWAYASFWQLDPNSNTLRFAQESGQVNAEFAQITRTASFAKGVGLSGRTWAKGEAFFVEDLGDMTDCCRREVAQRVGVKSGICIPIYAGTLFLGTMDFFTTNTLKPSAQRLEAFNNITHFISTALERVNKLDMQSQAAMASSEISSSMSRASDLANSTREKGLSTHRIVEELTQAALEINSIVELINGISSQTNLLALNATIEAARAGEMGKGFAVVANEVKNLAQKSSEATVSIQKQIQQIQQKTQETSISIGQMIEGVTEISEANNSIASAIEEQSVIINNLASA
jgi:methyl-accepting chemotaxis protein